MVHQIRDARRSSPRVGLRRQARLQQIVAEALALAREEGREALTVQRLTERLDVTPGALYRYFPSIHALVAELQRSVLIFLDGTTRRAVADAEAWAAGQGLPAAESALLAVLTTGLAFERFAVARPIEFGILSMYLNAPEDALPGREARRVFQPAWSNLAKLAERLDRAVHVGALDAGASAERAVAVWAGLQGVIQSRKLARSARGRIDPERVARGLFTALLVGWGADAVATARLLRAIDSHGFAEPTGSVDDLLLAAGG